MDISVEQVQANSPITIMKLDGELDASCYKDVIAKTQELYEDGTRNLILDMSDLSFMASSGLISLYNMAFIMRGEHMPDANAGWSVLHEIRDEISNTTAAEANFKLLSPQPRILKTLQMTGFDKLISQFDSREEALNSFN